MRVEDVMTRDVATARPETGLKDLVEQLAGRKISGVPVVDDDDVVLGVISEADILAKALPEPDRPGGVLARVLGRSAPEDRQKLEATVVRQAMTSPAITIDAQSMLPVAAERMIEHRINRLPVVRQQRLVGIITQADIVRAFARSDDDHGRHPRGRNAPAGDVARRPAGRRAGQRR